jgi:hypothetical protein
MRGPWDGQGKKHTPEQIVILLRQIEVELDVVAVLMSLLPRLPALEQSRPCSFIPF